MKKIQLYPEWEKAHFKERLNRFVMVLEKQGKKIHAYIANPGRMAEFLIPGHTFFIIPAKSGKYAYRVVATFYGNSFVLLDTGKVNYIVELMLRNGKIRELPPAPGNKLKREFKIKRSRFDFLIEREGKKPVLLEVKSCSLCHRGLALFPDAPTERGRRHIEELEALTKQGYESYTLYLITNKKAVRFMPNCHTDPEYGSAFNEAENVHFLAYGVEMPDPVTIDLSTCRSVEIDFEKSRDLCKDRGCYLLVLYNEQAFKKKIGALGEREFKRGYYVYTGTALRGLESRIKRHQRKTKKIHWHLDYVFPYLMKKEKTYNILTINNNMEERLAGELQKISTAYVPGFGSSDTGAPSHFFFFKENPVKQRSFINLLLDFRVQIF